MYLMALHPFRKINLKAAMLVPILLLSMFPAVPLVNTQIAPNIAKISPLLLNEIANAGESVNVLIKTFTNDYSSVVAQINDLGGKVGFLYKYVTGLSASLPTNKILELTQNSLIERIYYEDQVQMSSAGTEIDELLADPTILEEEFETVAYTSNELPSADLSNYWNTIGMGAQDIWAETNMGAGSLVVVIDTGIWTSHFMFAPKVALGEIVGGIDVSRDNPDVYAKYPPAWPWEAKYLGWDNALNHYHGGHCAGTVASRGGVIASPGTRLYIYARALEEYGGITLPTDELGRKTIWLLGMAPAASLYIVKIFDHTGASIPRGIIVAAFEHVLDLKLVKEYDVDVLSMSFGGGAMFDGRDFYEQLIDTFTKNDISPVAAAGNNGPASMTVATPGAAYTAITAGMAADPVHTRAYWDYFYLRPAGFPPGPALYPGGPVYPPGVMPPGPGPKLFTSATPQIDTISSRGPTADGRLKPTLSATGRYVFSAYITGGATGLAWASGTSMATPAIAGATALLNAWSEMVTVGASPEDYKQALTTSAEWLPGYNQYDQGAGYLNATTALKVLQNDPSYGDEASPLPEEGQLMDIRNIPIVTAGVYTTSIVNLPPGHHKEFIFQVTETTDSIRLEVTNVVFGSPWGLNSLEVYIQSAKRTVSNYYIFGANVIGNSWFYITDDATTWSVPTFAPEPTFSWGTRVIEPGYVKVVIQNDWTSYDNASADIKIEVTKAKKTKADITYTGLIWPGQKIGWISVPVPVGKTKAIIELWWSHNWNTYPTNDLDLVLIWSGAPLGDYRGASWNSPERVVLIGPTGTIYLLIDGYNIYTGRQPFEVRIYFV